jgi:hypothetical protein
VMCWLAASRQFSTLRVLDREQAHHGTVSRLAFRYPILIVAQRTKVYSSYLPSVVPPSQCCPAGAAWPPLSPVKNYRVHPFLSSIYHSTPQPPRPRFPVVCDAVRICLWWVFRRVHGEEQRRFHFIVQFCSRPSAVQIGNL